MDDKPKTDKVEKALAWGASLATGVTVAGMAGPSEWATVAKEAGVPFVGFLFVLFLLRWCAVNIVKPLVETLVNTQKQQATAIQSLAECQGIQSDSIVCLRESVGGLERGQCETNRLLKKILNEDEPKTEPMP